LITLAELAWLAAFALLFAYRGKVGELGRLHRAHAVATNQVAQLQSDLQLRAPDIFKLRQDYTAATNKVAQLQAQLADLEAQLDQTASEGLRVALQRRIKELEKADAERQAAEVALREELARAQAETTRLAARLAAMPPDAEQLQSELEASRAKLAEAEERLKAALASNAQLAEGQRQREVGEYSVRRELTGLPDGDLQRVVFLVDISSSMRNSPAWQSARKLIRTWLEFLPVEECALVTFSDDANGFPEEGYHRVRQADGTELAGQRERLLKAFDEAGRGTYTDLLKGLRRAYQYPAADVLVLFTDGHPRVRAESERAVAEGILKEVAKHPGIPILTVALGSYEIENEGGPRPKINAPVAFLKELAKQSGGSFMGR
jgi:Mg-chelatase subunit ChlD